MVVHFNEITISTSENKHWKVTDNFYFDSEQAQAHRHSRHYDNTTALNSTMLEILRRTREAVKRHPKRQYPSLCTQERDKE